MSLVLNVEILGEYKKLSKATQGAQTTLSKLGTKFADVGKKVAKITAGIGLGLGAAIASQIKPAIDAASDLEQQYGAIDSVFKELAPEMKTFAQNAYGIGLSTADAARNATLLGSQLKGFGMDTAEASATTQQLINLGADLAATFGGTTSDAVASLSSLFKGEYNPIEKYGVALRKSDVSARLAAQGLDGLTGEALKTAEAQAALELVLMKTTDAQGQAAREAETFAAQSETLTATLTNVRAEIGEKLLPIFVDLVKYVSEDILPAIEAFWTELTDPNGEAMRQIEALGDAWDVFVGTFNAGSTEVKSNDVFKWIGDSTVSVIKNLTHLSTFVGEIFEGMSKIFAAGFSVGPLAQSLRTSGIRQISGAMGAANRAASQIRFSDELYRDNTLGMTPGSPSVIDTININIPNASVNADRIIADLDYALRSRGLATIGTAQ